MGCDIFVIDVHAGFQEKLCFYLMGCDIFVIDVHDGFQEKLCF